MLVQRTHSGSDNYKKDINWRYLKQHLARFYTAQHTARILTPIFLITMSVVSRDSIITSPQEEMGGPDRFSKKDQNIHLNWSCFHLEDSYQILCLILQLIGRFWYLIKHEGGLWSRLSPNGFYYFSVFLYIYGMALYAVHHILLSWLICNFYIHNSIIIWIYFRMAQ